LLLSAMSLASPFYGARLDFDRIDLLSTFSRASPVTHLVLVSDSVVCLPFERTHDVTYLSSDLRLQPAFSALWRLFLSRFHPLLTVAPSQPQPTGRKNVMMAFIALSLFSPSFFAVAPFSFFGPVFSELFSPPSLSSEIRAFLVLISLLCYIAAVVCEWPSSF